MTVRLSATETALAEALIEDVTRKANAVLTVQRKGQVPWEQEWLDGFANDVLALAAELARVTEEARTMRDALTEWANRYGDCATAGAVGTMTDLDETMLARAEKHLLELAASSVPTEERTG